MLIPATLDPKQALRLRRFGLATLNYVLASAMVATGWMFDAVPASTLIEAMTAFLAVNLALYAVIRSGLNLRFGDPSLTRIQIVAAMTVLMYIVYHMDSSRNLALFACFIVFLFGIFRLSVRESTVLVLYTLAAYALVINLLMHFRPQAIQDVPAAWLSWLGLAGFLPCYIIIGAQINGLRRRMRESEARFRSLTEMSSDFYWESDTEHRLTQRASADKKVSGVSVFHTGTQIGERRWEIPSLSPDEAGWRAHRAVLDAHQPFREFELSRLGTDGTERYFSIAGDPVFDAVGRFTGYRGVGTDITERKGAEERIAHLAHHDSLTGLPNRLLFNDRLDQAISLAKRDASKFALLYLDLDRFKPVNDTLGHTAGDQLLKEVATRIRQQVRESDTLARVGGDEFIVILPGITRREEAETVAQKIIDAIAAPFQLGSSGRGVGVGTSIGIAMYPADARGADALVKAADAAMYRAKATGAGFFPVTDTAALVAARGPARAIPGI